MNKPYLKVMDEVENPASADLIEDLTTELADKLPSFDLSHIKRLTNHVGILQHATYITPTTITGIVLTIMQGLLYWL